MSRDYLSKPGVVPRRLGADGGGVQRRCDVEAEETDVSPQKKEETDVGSRRWGRRGGQIERVDEQDPTRRVRPAQIWTGAPMQIIRLQIYVLANFIRVINQVD